MECVHVLLGVSGWTNTLLEMAMRTRKWARQADNIRPGAAKEILVSIEEHYAPFPIVKRHVVAS